MIDIEYEKRSQSGAETFALQALRGHPLFATELASEENRVPGGPAPISEAIERCLTIGWLDMGGPGSIDKRLWLTGAGRAELMRRSVRNVGGRGGDEASSSP